MQQYEITKKKRNLLLLTNYVLMTLAVVAISTLCILLVMGYRFNFSSQKVEQGALLQFNSTPTSANIALDGENLSFRTPGKRDVPVGTHDVTISRDGYRSWTKHFTLRAGEVRWLNYARLVPTTVETTILREFEGLGSELASPNREWIALVQKPAEPKVTLVDLRSAEKLAYDEIVLPNEALTLPAGSTHGFTVLEWGLNSKFFLVKHDFAGGHEYIRLNRDNKTDVVNISSKFGVTFSDVHFSTENVFYGVENGNVRRFDLGASSLSEPLAKDVVTMKLYGSSDLAYVRHKEAVYEVGIVVGNTTRTVATYDDTTPLLIDITKYFEDYFMAITRGASFELVKNPHKAAGKGLEKVVTLAYPGDIKWLDISSTGRHIVAGSGTQFMTYDIELARRTDTNLPGIPVDPARPLQWLDDFLLVSVADNKLRIADFDGENQQIITDALPGQPVVLSANNKLLYSFTKTTGGKFSLQVSRMTVE